MRRLKHDKDKHWTRRIYAKAQLGKRELWRDVVGYEGLYQVSNFGRVKSLNYHRSGEERVIAQRQDRYGYKAVNLSKPIIQIDLSTGEVTLWKSATQAAAALGKDRRGICRMCHTEKEHGGYAWKFANGGIIDENGIRVS